jgi:hypothetical protein
MPSMSHPFLEIDIPPWEKIIYRFCCHVCCKRVTYDLFLLSSLLDVSFWSSIIFDKERTYPISEACLTYVTYISNLGTTPWLWNLTDCRKWPTDRTCPMMELSVLLNRFCCIQKPPLSHAFHVSFFLRNRYSSLRKNHLSILLSSFHVIYACTITSAW